MLMSVVGKQTANLQFFWLISLLQIRNFLITHANHKHAGFANSQGVTFAEGPQI
jgi:hypothetical protein